MGDEVDLGEFLEYAVHMILWKREIYPRATFERQVCWGTSVFKNRHEKLSGYIAKYVRQVEGWLRQGLVQELVVSIHCPNTPQPVEKFRFILSSGTSASAASESLGECFFRAFFDKLYYKRFPTLAENSTFRLFALCSEDLADSRFSREWLQESAKAVELQRTKKPQLHQGVEREKELDGQEKRIIDPIVSLQVSNACDMDAWYETLDLPRSS